MGRQVETIPSDTMRDLVNWPWLGNVRELENFIQRAIILSPGRTLRAPLAEPTESIEIAVGTLAEIEHEHISRVLRATSGMISAAATRLGIPRTTLNAKMRKLGITRE